jgi:actin-like ATPase involved in cell morphogenesis
MTEAGGRQALGAILGAGEKRGLIVGNATARRLFAMADALEGWPDEVGGRDMAAGAPRCIEVGRAEIVAALELAHAGIADVCRAAIARFKGAADEPVRLVLAGGGAGRPLEESLKKGLSVTVERLADPGAASARGLGRILAES